jgi:streptogramin lyase
MAAASACSVNGGGPASSGHTTSAHVVVVHTGVARDLPVGAGPYDLAAGFGSVWVAATDGVARVDPQSGRVVASIRIANDGESTNVALGAGAVWYLESPGAIVRIDPDRDVPTARREFGTGHGRDAFENLAANRAGVCAGKYTAVSDFGGTICFDRRLRHERVLDAGPGPIAALANGPMWVGGQALHRIDPASGSITPVRLPHRSSVPAVVAAGDSAWAAVDVGREARARLWHLGGRGVISKRPLPLRFVSALAVDGQGRIWAIAHGRSRRRAALYLVRRDGTVARIAGVHFLARGLASTPAALWTANYRAGTITRVSRYLVDR